MARTKDFRRAQSERIKAKHRRDWISKTTGSGSSGFIPTITDSRHPMDCGHRCFMCHGEKLLFGRRIERYNAKREIRMFCDNPELVTFEQEDYASAMAELRETKRDHNHERAIEIPDVLWLEVFPDCSGFRVMPEPK